jgi:hypothetical protein
MYTCEGEVYCEFCAPEDANHAMFPEFDTPQNCGECYRPLSGSLLAEGITYVIEAAWRNLEREDAWAIPVEDHGPHAEGSWYYGSSPAAVVQEWIEVYGIDEEADPVIATHSSISAFCHAMRIRSTDPRAVRRSLDGALRDLSYLEQEYPSTFVLALKRIRESFSQEEFLQKARVTAEDLREACFPSSLSGALSRAVRRALGEVEAFTRIDDIEVDPLGVQVDAEHVVYTPNGSPHSYQDRFLGIIEDYRDRTLRQDAKTLQEGESFWVLLYETEEPDLSEDA